MYLIKYRYTRRKNWSCDRLLTRDDYVLEMQHNKRCGHKIIEFENSAIVTIDC